MCRGKYSTSFSPHSRLTTAGIVVARAAEPPGKKRNISDSKNGTPARN